jgi:vancomycin permeability regulator SanA
MKKWLRKTTSIILILIFILSITIISIDSYVKNQGLKHIVKQNDAQKVDAILILGAHVYSNGMVSIMLKDRLLTGLELYHKGKAAKILVSGDHGKRNYDEVNTMKNFLIARGVKNEDIFMDHAGFSTYESLYRARDIFQAKKLIVVTQQYHLMRSLFIAHQLGLEAQGVSADKQNYGSVMVKYNLREMAARNKDFLTAQIFRPKPKYLGEAIPVSGDGRLTNDK